MHIGEIRSRCFADTGEKGQIQIHAFEPKVSLKNLLQAPVWKVTHLGSADFLMVFSVALSDGMG